MQTLKPIGNSDVTRRALLISIENCLTARKARVGQGSRPPSALSVEQMRAPDRNVAERLQAKGRALAGFDLAAFAGTSDAGHARLVLSQPPADSRSKADSAEPHRTKMVPQASSFPQLGLCPR